jgi:hypothetical protein
MLSYTTDNLFMKPPKVAIVLLYVTVVFTETVPIYLNYHTITFHTQ